MHICPVSLHYRTILKWLAEQSRNERIPEKLMASETEESTSLPPDALDEAQSHQRHRGQHDAITLLRRRAAFERPQQSNSINQNIQRTLQSVAVIGQRPDWFSEFRSWNGSKFLNADDPRCPVNFNRRRQPGKGRILASITQGCYDARRLYADQVSLKIHDKLPASQAIKVKLCHRIRASEASKLGEGQSLVRNLISIGADRCSILLSPAPVSLCFGRLRNRRLRQARHVETKGPSRLRHIRIQRKINLYTTHRNLPENTYV